MQDISLNTLIISLIGLLLLSAIFSGSETALMAINRYRMRHLANEGHKGAQRAQRLLSRPDRLIGVILLGNNLVNIFAATISTLIAMRVAGEAGLIVAPFILAVIVLIFSEVAPKTWAASHPESIAYPMSVPLALLLRLLSPVVAVINFASNTLLRPLGVKPGEAADNLSREELRTLVNESGHGLDGYSNMVLNILDLEQASVLDIIVPRNEMVAIDLSEGWDEVVHQITNTFYTRLPVYEGEIDNIIGILHVRTVLPRMARGTLDAESLRKAARKPYFIPESTSLPKQLLEFQERERRMGLVVDEYGDIQGLLTLDDILEEIVGEFTSEPKPRTRRITKDREGVFVIDGAENIRHLNRRLGWNLPSEGPKTLNGLLLELLESIPEPGTEVQIEDLHMTIRELQDNVIKTVEVREYVVSPPIVEATEPEADDL